MSSPLLLGVTPTSKESATQQSAAKKSDGQKSSSPVPGSGKTGASTAPAAKIGASAAKKPATGTTASTRPRQVSANAKKGSSSRRPAQHRVTRQTQPMPERYKEIQEALATKGYLEGAGPTGVWDDSSVSALKKFQQDQNLEPSGKIDSLSLIALGLGPKREQPPAPPPAEPKP